MINGIQGTTNYSPVYYSNTNNAVYNNKATQNIPYTYDSYKANTVEQSKKERGLHKVYDNIKTFLKTPTGKMVMIGAGVALAASLVFTPILPWTVTVIGGGVAAIGTGLVRLGGAVAGSSGAIAIGLAALRTGITRVITSPFAAGFLGGVAGSIVGHWLMEKTHGNPCPQQPNHPVCPPQPPVTPPPVVPQPPQPPVCPPQPPVTPPPVVPQPPQPPVCPSQPEEPQNLINGPDTPAETPVYTVNCDCDCHPLPDTAFQFKMAKAELTSIEGLDTSSAAKFKSIGINNVGQLLKEGISLNNRLVLASKTGISPVQIVNWIEKADMMRFTQISGLGLEYADFLKEAGVCNIGDLKTRNPYALFRKLQQVNTDGPYVDRLPSVELLDSWIKRAGKLPKIVNY